MSTWWTNASSVLEAHIPPLSEFQPLPTMESGRVALLLRPPPSLSLWLTSRSSPPGLKVTFFYSNLSLFIYLFLVVLGFELKVLRLQTLYHLSQSSSPSPGF
jgi:hypothetical protein